MVLAEVQAQRRAPSSVADSSETGAHEYIYLGILKFFKLEKIPNI